nr:methyltransferase domain-containing protein [uncultured Desulfuromonas sp.]
MKTPPSPFDENAAQYDAWFDSRRGRRIFALERDCLRQVLDPLSGRWLEVGVGTGRFAQAFGIATGIDLSSAMLSIAAQRGITTITASAEHLPFAEGTFDGILQVCVFCFLTNPLKVLEECWRVLKNKGHLVIGFIPADSLWGDYHTRRGKQGHSYYSFSRFYTLEEITALATRAGFSLLSHHGCELPSPDEAFTDDGSLRKESFVVVRFTKKISREKLL